MRPAAGAVTGGPHRRGGLRAGSARGATAPGDRRRTRPARLERGVHGLRGRRESGHGFGACHAGSPGSQVLAPLFLQTESRVEGSIRLLSLALRLLTLVEFVLRR